MERIRYIFAEALVIWAYACLVNGYFAAAAAIAILAVCCSFGAFTKRQLLKIMPVSLILSLIGLWLVHSCRLTEYQPYLGIVTSCGVHVALIWPAYYPRETETVRRGMMICGLCYTVLAVLIPSSQFGIREMMTLLLLIFGPGCGMYFLGLLKEEAKIKPVAGRTAMR